MPTRRAAVLPRYGRTTRWTPSSTASSPVAGRRRGAEACYWCLCCRVFPVVGAMSRTRS
ncbi:hypothetical protein CABS01_17066, partial [Colletotrichum abscissum]